MGIKSPLTVFSSFRRKIVLQLGASGRCGYELHWRFLSRVITFYQLCASMRPADSPPLSVIRQVALCLYLRTISRQIFRTCFWNVSEDSARKIQIHIVLTLILHASAAHSHRLLLFARLPAGVMGEYEPKIEVHFPASVLAARGATVRLECFALGK